MAKIKILCTSTGCIEYAPERYRNLGIGIVRVHMFFEGKEYLVFEGKTSIGNSGKNTIVLFKDKKVRMK